VSNRKWCHDRGVFFCFVAFLFFLLVFQNSASAQPLSNSDEPEKIVSTLEAMANSSNEGVKEAAARMLNVIQADADAGNPQAQNLLGRLYDSGRLVKRDEKIAIEWFRRSAVQGLAESQFSLAFKLFKTSKSESISWFQKSAAQGYAIAQYYLGLLYSKGDGVPRNEEMAYFWLLLASSSGNRSAISAREVVEEKLSNQQRAMVQANARKWKPGNPESTDLVSAERDNSSRPADSSGSGVRISRQLVVTNSHVIENCAQIRVNNQMARLHVEDRRNDLALLHSFSSESIAKLRTRRVLAGENVAVAGFPLRGVLSGFNITTGNVSSLSGMGGDTRFFQVSAPVQQGNSGGPMLDSSGSLMGIIVSKLDAVATARITGDIPQNVNFGLNFNTLRAFLDANGVEYENSIVETRMSTSDIAEKARGFTVLVECWK
jgi:S1-C subfamily serine protease